MEQKRLIVIYAAIIFVVAFGVLILLNIAKSQDQSQILTSNELVENPPIVTYKGILPCADCTGREVSLVLHKEDSAFAKGTYEMTTVYLGQDVDPVIEKGDWITEEGDAVDQKALIVVLNPTSATNMQRFLVADSDSLQEIDLNGKPLEIPGQNTKLTLQ